MTARLVFEATLIELSKVLAPSLKLYEFNYLFNKAINQYINKVYNVYDINQQTTDDLRVLKSTCFLTPHKVELAGRGTDAQKDSAILNVGAKTGGHSESYNGQAKSYLSRAHSSILSLHGATYEVFLPIDYLHMLNCVCIYYVAKTKDCWDAGSYIEIPANRLTADSWSLIVTDVYNRPSPMRPYYYIHNLNLQLALPTDPRTTVTTNAGLESVGIDMNGIYKVTTNGDWVDDGNEGLKFDASSTEATSENSNFQRTFKLVNLEGEETEISLVEKPIAARLGNTSNVRCEIRYGKKLNKNTRFCPLSW